MPYSLAADIGGTFTDFVLVEHASGDLVLSKVPSTPDDPSEAILKGIDGLGIDLAEIEFFVHGTTIGLNALLQGKGAKTGMITTRGFRDVYEIGRMDRTEMYNYFYRKPRPLIPRRHIFEVDERIDAAGRILKPVAEEQVEAGLEYLIQEGIESVAVCTLHSYANPVNESRIGQIAMSRWEDLPVSLSHQVANEWREYERTSTTALNAYLRPLVRRYLDRLGVESVKRGFAGSLLVMQCNGGVMTVGEAKVRPVQTLVSGPVGGCAGSAMLGTILGHDNIISVDMGGTSFDVSLIVDGKLEVTTQAKVEGLPIMVPMVRVDSIGAGGGSIARVETGQALRVGPESAGAEPGPVCYGRGGQRPTVTDANLVLGLLAAESFSAWGMRLHSKLAEEAIRTRVADPLGLGVQLAADGIRRVINSRMAYAIREATVGQGLSPQDFVMLAFGGAGPMHAVDIAGEIGIPKVIVPIAPGAFSAWGMLSTDFRHDRVKTLVRRASDCSDQQVEAIFAKLQSGDERLGEGQYEFLRYMDLRYGGQEHTLNVATPLGTSVAGLKSLFDEAHRRKFGYRMEANPVEIVNVRLVVVGKVPKTRLRSIPAGSSDASVALKSHRSVYFNGGFVETAIYCRDDLRANNVIEGPAIVEERVSTTVLPPGYRLLVDGYGNLIIEREQR